MTKSAEHTEAEEAKPMPKEWVPEGRQGTIVDMAGAILFLASRAGGYMNGNVVVIDGGRLGILPATY